MALLYGGAEVMRMVRNDEIQRDTGAWIFQVWASFALAVGTTSIGIAYMPVDPWLRAFLGMGLLFSVGSTFSLSKTIRDNHESKRLLNRLSEAKTEKIIREFEINDAGNRSAV
ncbi:MAG TPA: YiaA/YiaB family inner membrane protein [Polyangiaceae bacterium]